LAIRVDLARGRGGDLTPERAQHLHAYAADGDVTVVFDHVRPDIPERVAKPVPRSDG
jgi:hypothetical protein